MDAAEGSANPRALAPVAWRCCPFRGYQVEDKAKKKKKGKKGKQEQGDVQGELDCGPDYHSGRCVRMIEENANFDELSSSFSQSGASGRPKRRSIFEGLAIEEEWRAARKELKQMLFLDTVCFFLWSTEFIWILMRERCPPGSFNGWCVGRHYRLRPQN